MCSLVYLQCIFSMKDHPESAGIQICSRLLIFYGELKYITSFVDQVDKSFSSSLIVPYQFLNPPGSDVVFSLEKHFSSIITAAIGGDDDNVVFTLSNDKLVIFSMSLVQEMENFKLDKLKNEPCFLIVYSHKEIDRDIKVMKDMTGGFIIASCDEILSYSFEMNLFYRKCFTDEIISNVFIVSDSEFMVSYKNRKYFDIYDVNEDKLVIRKSFDKIIHFVVANTLQKFITLTRNFKNQRSLHIVKVAVVFESTEIRIFEVRKHEREIRFELKSHLPPAGFDSYSVFYGNIEINVSILFLSLKDGSIILVSTEYEYEFFKPLKKEVMFTFKGFYLSYENKAVVLLIGSDNHIYFYDDNNFFEIPGNFDDATIYKKNTILAFSNGIINTFQFNFKKDAKDYSIIQLRKYDVHFDKISFYFIKDSMMLTTSHDSTMKCMIISNNIASFQNKNQFNLEKCEKDIKRLVYIDKNDKLISLMINSNRLNLWNLSNGKKLRDIQANDIITNCLCISNNLIIISGIIEIYDLDDFKIKSKFKLEKCKQSYYFQTNQNDLLIFSENLSKIEMYKINVNETQKSINSLILKPNGLIDLSSYGSIDNNNNVCLTCKNNLLVLSINSELLFIDINSKQVILKHNIENENKRLKYFLTPVNLSLNKLKYLKSTFNNNLIGLGNLNNLMAINYDFKENRLKIYDSNDSTSMQFESFEINENKVIAYGNGQLVGFDLGDSNPFSKPSFSIKLNGSTIEMFGLSMNKNYVYFIENRTVLKFYRWNDNEKIGETQLHCKPINIICTNDYLSLAMQDRKIISFLICDPLVPNSIDKIKDLESRCFNKLFHILNQLKLIFFNFFRNITKSDDEKKLVKNILKNSTEILENSSSDEDEIDANELFEENESEVKYELSKSSNLKENDSSSEEETEENKKKRTYKNLRKGMFYYNCLF